MTRTPPWVARRERQLREQDYWRHWRSVSPQAVPCCVCGGRDTEPFTRAPAAPGDVVRCRGCGMVFVSPVRVRGLDLSPEQEAEAERLKHSSDLADLDGCWEMQFLDCEETRTANDDNHRAVLDVLHRNLPSRGRLLDFGAGWGQFVERASEDGWEAVGIEPTPGRALHAREARGVDVRTTTLTPGLFDAASFDAVVSLQVFEHLEDPATELDRIAEVLRPGGILALEVPSIASPLVRVMGGTYRHFNPDHFWFFSPETLRRFVCAHGFSVRECYSPTRRLSVEWVSQAIVAGYLPRRVGDALVRSVKATRLGEVVVGINVRDIVMVVAERDP